MNIAYVTHYDSRVLKSHNNWSGLGYYIAKSIEGQDISINYVGPLQVSFLSKVVLKYKQFFHKFITRKFYEKDSNLSIMRDYSKQAHKEITATNPDIVFSATIRTIVFLECEQPIVFWGDATYANLIGFYPQYDNLCQESLENWHMVEKIALEKCSLAIYSSDWAAQKAIETYGVNPAKVKVVPFGANIECFRELPDIQEMIEARPANRCKLLFLGVDWYRKGGDIAFQIAERLNELGMETELTVVGCEPDLEGGVPDFVNPVGFISKSTEAGKEKLNQLISESHFLILPSRAECFGVVFCEANSFGVPCIARRVGGIPTIIKPGINGNLFDVDANISEYCDYIYNLFKDYERYRQLAFDSFHEYQTRLNWSASGKVVQEMLEDILA